MWQRHDDALSGRPSLPPGSSKPLDAACAAQPPSAGWPPEPSPFHPVASVGPKRPPCPLLGATPASASRPPRTRRRLFETISRCSSRTSNSTSPTAVGHAQGHRFGEGRQARGRACVGAEHHLTPVHRSPVVPDLIPGPSSTAKGSAAPTGAALADALTGVPGPPGPARPAGQLALAPGPPTRRGRRRRAGARPAWHSGYDGGGGRPTTGTGASASRHTLTNRPTAVATVSTSITQSTGTRKDGRQEPDAEQDHPLGPLHEPALGRDPQRLGLGPLVGDQRGGAEDGERQQHQMTGWAPPGTRPPHRAGGRRPPGR